MVAVDLVAVVHVAADATRDVELQLHLVAQWVVAQLHLLQVADQHLVILGVAAVA